MATWTATGVKLLTLKITPRAEGVLHVERRYEMLDAEGEVLKRVKGGRVVTNVDFVSLPEGVQSALLAIDAWTKTQALEQEGLT